MKPNKYSQFFAILKQVNANGACLTKEEVVRKFTGGKTDSLSSLSPVELAQVVSNLSSLTAQRQLRITPEQQAGDRLRKGIISQFLSIGKTVDDAKRWAEKYGVNGQKKSFNNYSNQELYLLFRNAQKIKSQTIKSFNKRQ